LCDEHKDCRASRGILATLVATLNRLVELHRIAGSRGDPPVRRVVLVEDLGRIADATEHELVMLTRAASDEAIDYRLDMALKLAGSRGVSALVLTDGRAAIPPTAARIAERDGVVVCGADADVDLAWLLSAIERELAGEAPAALARIGEAVAALRDAEEEGASADELLEAARAWGRVRVGDPDADEAAAVVVVDEEREASVCVGAADPVLASVLAEVTAGAVGRARTAARHAEDVPIRSRGQLLTEFLLAPTDRSGRLLDRMRAAGLIVDGWHVAVRVEVDGAEAVDELAAHRRGNRIGRIALEQARIRGGAWHLAELGAALVLVLTSRRDPGGRDVLATAEAIVRQIAAREPDVTVVCGVGSTHSGAVGLRATSAEARAAVAAARAGRLANVAVAYDALGLERTLMEWYASDTAREAVDSLLAPLQELEPVKRDAWIRTLQSYLDHQGSLSRAAEELHLHRNAVAYRIDRIYERLGLDREDADVRLLLQLACRARSLR
jgi:PucR C-terminal helix-turn-helix domain/GGDEF-like domain